jgi:acyl-coenzyme A thioesterase PaaI-like protein
MSLALPTNLVCSMQRTLRANTFKCLRNQSSLQQQPIRSYHAAPITVSPINEITSQLQASNEKSRIESLISSLPIVRYLRDWPKQMSRLDVPVYGETRLHNGHHASVEGKHLTAGSILGRDKITVAPHLFIQQGPPFRAVTVCHIGTHLCGHPGYVHGGVPFFLFDDIFARCASVAFPSGVGLTANLNMNFRKPMTPGRLYVIRAEMKSLEGRKLQMTGTMRCLPTFSAAEMEARDSALTDELSLGEESGDIVAEATSLFIEPKYAEVCVAIISQHPSHSNIVLTCFSSQWFGYSSKLCQRQYP